MAFTLGGYTPYVSGIGSTTPTTGGLNPVPQSGAIRTDVINNFPKLEREGGFRQNPESITPQDITPWQVAHPPTPAGFNDSGLQPGGEGPPSGPGIPFNPPTLENTDNTDNSNSGGNSSSGGKSNAGGASTSFDLGGLLSGLGSFLGGPQAPVPASASNGAFAPAPIPVQTDSSTSGSGSMGKLLLIAAVVGIGWYGYKKGWFSKLTGGSQ